MRLTRPAVIGERLIDDVSLTFAAGRLTKVGGGIGQTFGMILLDENVASPHRARFRLPRASRSVHA